MTSEEKADRATAEQAVRDMGFTLNPTLSCGPEKYVRCLLGDLRLYRHIVDHRIDRALILEDDVGFYPQADVWLDQYMRTLEQDRPFLGRWDITWFHSQTAIHPHDARQYLRPCYLIPMEPGRAALDRNDFWTWRSANVPGAMFGGRQLVQRPDGGYHNHVYRGWEERLSTMAVAVRWRVLDFLLRANRWAEAGDWYLGWLSSPGLKTEAYICSPFLCCRNHQLDQEGGL